MPEPLAHLYDLALRAIEAQERQMSELRARLAPVLAAGGLGTTLLSGPVFGGAHPSGAIEWSATTIAVLGLLGSLCAAGYLLMTRGPAYELDAQGTMEWLRRRGGLEDPPVFYSSLIVTLGAQRARGAVKIGRLQVAFTVMVCGILLELGGFALAAAIR